MDVLLLSFILKSPDGTPWLSMSDFTPNAPSLVLPDNLLPETTDESERDNVPVYEWRGAQGNWQFSDQPPQGRLNKSQLIQRGIAS